VAGLCDLEFVTGIGKRVLLIVVTGVVSRRIQA
jgi:hypothetical protein